MAGWSCKHLQHRFISREYDRLQGKLSAQLHPATSEITSKHILGGLVEVEQLLHHFRWLLLMKVEGSGKDVTNLNKCVPICYIGKLSSLLSLTSGGSGFFIALNIWIYLTFWRLYSSLIRNDEPHTGIARWSFFGIYKAESLSSWY